MPCSENIIYRILKYKGRVFVKNDTLESSNDGIFYCLHKNEVALIKAGDIIKLGKCSFRVLMHNCGVFSEIGDRPNQEDKFLSDLLERLLSTNHFPNGSNCIEVSL